MRAQELVVLGGPANADLSLFSFFPCVLIGYCVRARVRVFMTGGNGLELRIACFFFPPQRKIQPEKGKERGKERTEGERGKGEVPCSCFVETTALPFSFFLRDNNIGERGKTNIGEREKTNRGEASL